jgi:hypothetical protein
MASSRPANTHRSSVIVGLLAAFAVIVPLRQASGQTVINVPADTATIQAAIDASVPGDTVLVAPGTYFENIDFRGKAITVESAQGPEVTILDGNLAGPVVTFTSGEGPASVVLGFTLQRGDAGSDHGHQGGGVRIEGSSPTVQGNIITNNRACNSGAGIDARFSSARIEDNLITNNSQFGCSGGVGGGGISVGGEGQTQIIDNIIMANSWQTGSGGGIELFAAGAPTIRGNVIRANSAYDGGGGIDIVNQSDALIVQNLIIDNQAGQGGGIYWGVPYGARGPLLVNNTIANNQGNGSGIFATGFDAQAQLFNNIVVGASGQSAVYCDPYYDPSPPALVSNNVYSSGASAYGGSCGDLTGINGNISGDPLFVDPVANDYHLAAGSPSIDAGDNSAPALPAVDVDGDPRISGGIVDQGVDEFPAVRPSAPVDLTAVRLHNKAIVSWSPPASDGGSAILSYTVTVSDGRRKTVKPSTTTITFDEIKKQTTYTFTVVATNAVGPGDPASATLLAI